MTSPQSLSTAPLDELLQSSPHVWRGRELARADTRSTGFTALDARLPGGGWPVGAVTEIAPACDGVGELSLTLPALRSVCNEGGSVAFVQPPYIPYAPALRRCGLELESFLWIHAGGGTEALWAAEQLLREGAGAVLLWSCLQDERALRRLQLAAERGRACAFVYRPACALDRSSPAAVRVALSAAGESLRLELVKVRGGHPGTVIVPLGRSST